MFARVCMYNRPDVEGEEALAARWAQGVSLALKERIEVLLVLVVLTVLEVVSGTSFDRTSSSKDSCSSWKSHYNHWLLNELTTSEIEELSYNESKFQLQGSEGKWEHTESGMMSRTGSVPDDWTKENWSCFESSSTSSNPEYTSSSSSLLLSPVLPGEGKLWNGMINIRYLL